MRLSESRERRTKFYCKFLGVIRSPGDRASISMRARNFMGAGCEPHGEGYPRETEGNRSVGLSFTKTLLCKYPSPCRVRLLKLTFLLLPGPNEMRLTERERREEIYFRPVSAKHTKNDTKRDRRNEWRQV